MATRARPLSVITAATGGKCSVLMIAARWKFSAAGHSPIPVCLFDRKAQNFQDEKCIFHFSTRRGELRSPAGKKRCLRANTVRPTEFIHIVKQGCGSKRSFLSTPFCLFCVLFPYHRKQRLRHSFGLAQTLFSIGTHGAVSSSRWRSSSAVSSLSAREGFWMLLRR